MAVNIVLEKKAQQWREATVYIAGKIFNYSGEEQDSFIDLFLLIDEDNVKQMMLTEKCKLLSIFANQISVKDSELSTYVNQFVGICESIYSKPDKFKEFKSILKAKGWLDDVDKYKSEETNWQKEQEEKWNEEQRRKQYEREEEQRRKQREEEQRRKEQETKKYNVNPNSYQHKTKKKRSKWWLWILLLLGVLWGINEFWYKDYVRDKEASRTYVYATNLFLRATKDAESEYNRIGKIPYGSELITYSDVNGWAEVKFDGEEGYVSSDYLLGYNDFQLLDGIWGNEEAKEVVMTSKCRRALLDLLKKNEWNSGPNGWQLYTKQKEMKPNSVLYPELNNGYDTFSDFAFILTDNVSQKRIFFLYSFDKDETPIFIYQENAPEKGDIKSVSYLKKNGKYKVVYSRQNNILVQKNETEAKLEEKSHNVNFRITKVEFANVDYNNNIISSYGEKLYQDTKYLKAKLEIEKNTETSENVKFQMKILRPDGTLIRGSVSPVGYTLEQEGSLTGKGGRFFTLGWGNNEGTVYTPGTYTYEVWCNGQKISATTFVIESRTQVVEEEPKKNVIPEVVETQSEENVIFEAVEESPEFPNGGMSGLMQYLSKNIKYPAIAQENGTQGRVIVQFVVNRDGSIVDAKVMRSVDPYLDKEALRVISGMPKWKPGKQRGKAVRCRFTVPVMFRLQ